MTLRALAPAKINLGLEILGRRDDGFHEIRTIMAAVSLFDRIQVRQSTTPRFHVDDFELAGEVNLVQRAMEAIRQDQPNTPAFVTLRKRIPLAAGLGGASSDAAATLIALDRCFVLNTRPERLVEMATELGSDVPFFLSGGRALLSGRGEVVTPLRPISHGFAVIVVPHLHIPSKTATLYKALKSSDFSDGTQIERSAKLPIEQFVENEESLRNAFERPLYEIAPQLQAITDVLRTSGAKMVALSGAGPAHYALEDDFDQTHRIARKTRDALGTSASVHVVRFITRGVVTNEEFRSEILWR